MRTFSDDLGQPVRLHRADQTTCQGARLGQPIQKEEIADRTALNEWRFGDVA